MHCETLTVRGAHQNGNGHYSRVAQTQPSKQTFVVADDLWIFFDELAFVLSHFAISRNKLSQLLNYSGFLLFIIIC